MLFVVLIAFLEISIDILESSLIKIEFQKRLLSILYHSETETIISLLQSRSVICLSQTKNYSNDQNQGCTLDIKNRNGLNINQATGTYFYLRFSRICFFFLSCLLYYETNLILEETFIKLTFSVKK